MTMIKKMKLRSLRSMRKGKTQQKAQGNGTLARKSEKSCSNDFCRLGCVCDSLSSGKPRRYHCGYVECMFECTCRIKKNGKFKRKIVPVHRKRRLINRRKTNGVLPLVNGFIHDYIQVLPSSKSKNDTKRQQGHYLKCRVKLQGVKRPNVGKVKLPLSIIEKCRDVCKSLKKLHGKNVSLKAPDQYKYKEPYPCKPCSVVLQKLNITKDIKVNSNIDRKPITSADCEKKEIKADTKPNGKNVSLAKRNINGCCYVILERIRI